MGCITQLEVGEITNPVLAKHLQYVTWRDRSPGEVSFAAERALGLFGVIEDAVDELEKRLIPLNIIVMPVAELDEAVEEVVKIELSHQRRTLPPWRDAGSQIREILLVPRPAAENHACLRDIERNPQRRL
ncbi:hypothetical protein GCM10027203_59790 [Nonomuraea fastidiosa]